MKLASYKDGRDGRLMVVSGDLKRAAAADGIARTMQAALDDWDAVAPKLQALSDAVNGGAGEAFDPARCAAPLPRAYSWTDGSVYLNHMRVLSRANGREMMAERETVPVMYQGGSDTLLGPQEDIVLAEDEPWGVDYEAEIGVILGDTPMCVKAEDALKHIRLFVLINDVSLRKVLGPELAVSFGPIMGKPSTAFAPVAVTPDELGDAWKDGKLDMVMVSHLNGKLMGKPSAGVGMDFNFGQLIAHLTRSRRVAAGAIIGTGTISNTQELEHSSVETGGVGYSCIAEVRTIEGIRFGAPRTSFMRFGDRVRIEMLDRDGKSVFGAIDQQLVKYTR